MINVEQLSSAVPERLGEKPRPQRLKCSYHFKQLGTAALHSFPVTILTLNKLRLRRVS